MVLIALKFLTSTWGKLVGLNCLQQLLCISLLAFLVSEAYHLKRMRKHREKPLRRWALSAHPIALPVADSSPEGHGGEGGVVSHDWTCTSRAADDPTVDA
jgi:hypothetical protein